MKYAIGLMSGTSLDGIDAVLCRIEGFGMQTKIEQIAFETYPLPEQIRQEIKLVCKNEVPTTARICSLNFALGKLFSEAVAKITAKAGLCKEDITFVASHGQTIYHLPKTQAPFCPSTLQIGEPAVIAYDNHVQVISNFRTMDIAAGGEGAPLVPYSELVLYADPFRKIALQNIGGIGNVTYIPNGKTDQVCAFDTGPGNMMIDEAMKQLFQLPFDDRGVIASQGNVDKILLTELMNHPYLKKEPPKSTGREQFGEQFVCELLTRYAHVAKKDIIATFTMFTARSIAWHYQTYLQDAEVMIVGGGGAHNQTLLRHLKACLPNVEIKTQEDYGFLSDAKEAIAFVLLGNETLHQRPSNVPSATGAKTNVVLGVITPNPWGERNETEN